jgi:hypothetical protein
MVELIAKCGFDCGHCPSYRKNLKTAGDREKCSNGWHRYHGFRLSPEKLLRCEGCLVPNEEDPIRYWKTGCRIRRCAVKNGVENCAYCSDYPCQDVKANCAYIDRERIAARLGAPIPEVDYLAFIEPYEGVKHLDRVRRSLRPKDIVKADKVSVVSRAVAFPDDLRLGKKEETALRAVHKLIAKVGTARGISHARQEVLAKARKDILKMLWAFGFEGTPKKKDGLHLEIDGDTYLTQKIHSSFSKLESYIHTLKKHGVRCKHVPLEKEGWLTPKGALRGKGWHLELSFADNAGGPPALRALQRYASRLDKRHGKNAFRYFARADMRVLRKR